MGAGPDSDVERALKAFGDLTLKYRSFGAIPLRLGQSLLMGSDPRIGDFADMPIGPAADMPPTNAAAAFPLLGSALSEARDVPVAAQYAPSAAAERWGGISPPAPAPRMNLAAQALARGRRNDTSVQSMPDTADTDGSRGGWMAEPAPTASTPRAEVDYAAAAPLAPLSDPLMSARSAGPDPVGAPAAVVAPTAASPLVIRPSTDPSYDSERMPPTTAPEPFAARAPIDEPPPADHARFESASFQSGSLQSGSFQSYAAPQSYHVASVTAAPPPFVPPVADSPTGEQVPSTAAERPMFVTRGALTRTETAPVRPPLAGLFRSLGQARDGTSPDPRPSDGPDRSAV